jgi:hypothetical protein
MRLEPLYRMTFDYPHGWSATVTPGGTESEHLFLMRPPFSSTAAGSVAPIRLEHARSSAG